MISLDEQKSLNITCSYKSERNKEINLGLRVIFSLG